MEFVKEHPSISKKGSNKIMFTLREGVNKQIVLFHVSGHLEQFGGVLFVVEKNNYFCGMG